MVQAMAESNSHPDIRGHSSCRCCTVSIPSRAPSGLPSVPFPKPSFFLPKDLASVKHGPTHTIASKRPQTAQPLSRVPSEGEGALLTCMLLGCLSPSLGTGLAFSILSHPLQQSSQKLQTWLRLAKESQVGRLGLNAQPPPKDPGLEGLHWTKGSSLSLRRKSLWRGTQHLFCQHLTSL